MKILRIIYDWPRPWQGLAAHPYEVTMSQRKLGYDIDIMCGVWPNQGGPVQISGVNIIPVLREPLENTIYFTSSIILFFKYLKYRKRNKVDIIHSHGHFAIWIYAYRSFLKKFFPWSKELQTPLVVHFHNTVKGRWEALLSKKQVIKYVSRTITYPMGVMSDKWAVDASAACLFVSSDTKAEAIKYYEANPEKCFLVETGVNTDLFVPVEKEEVEKSRKELGFDSFHKVILNHGVFLERKNIHLLIEALHLLPRDYRLLLAGTGGDDTYTEKLKELIKKYSLEDRIVMTGYVPYPEAPIAYQVSDVFVLPSGWEGLPKAVTQGLACGIPCVVSGFKMTEDIQGLIYLKDLEPQTIADTIVATVEGDVKVDRAKVVINHSWDVKVRTIETAYEYAKTHYI